MVVLDIPFLFTCCGYMWIMVTVYVCFFATKMNGGNRPFDDVAPYYMFTAMLTILMHLLQTSQWLAGWLCGSLATRLCLEQAATYLMFGFIISMNF